LSARCNKKKQPTKTTTPEQQKKEKRPGMGEHNADFITTATAAASLRSTGR